MRNVPVRHPFICLDYEHDKEQFTYAVVAEGTFATEQNGLSASVIPAATWAVF
ncbi:MAG: hypothetical protein JWN30_184, partial [Bacilli bacterium]|nr:hypothetical protein [Bacilli bacterium]